MKLKTLKYFENIEEMRIDNIDKNIKPEFWGYKQACKDLKEEAKAWQDELDKSLKQKIKKIGEIYGEDCIKAITVNILKMIHREKKDWINHFFNLEGKE